MVVVRTLLLAWVALLLLLLLPAHLRLRSEVPVLLRRLLKRRGSW
ncbi:MAG: hypothetical protein Q9Q40_14530 [Acidobacteriota bacterium]|nr:hypothetical protein [Acidobacteriota bacterium]